MEKTGLYCFKSQTPPGYDYHKPEIIPFLPGNTKQDANKNNFTVTQTLSYKDGIPTAKLDYPSIGNEFRHTIDTRCPPVSRATTRNLYAGWSQKKYEYTTLIPVNRDGSQAEPILPAYVVYDKMVLSFLAYFKEPVHESQVENERIRLIQIDYYLEDDTICLLEHKQVNSGIPQGTFLSRHKIPRDEDDISRGYIRIKDLAVGEDVHIYGKALHIYDANDSTREYFRRAYNKELAPPEDVNLGTHQQHRDLLESHIRVGTREPDKSFRVFLKNDRKVLRFNAVWNDTTTYGERRFFAVHYFLADNTMEVVELRAPNSGHEPFPAFVRRQRVPRDGRTVHEFSDGKFAEYRAEDLAVGKEVRIFGRSFLLYDADPFTVDYYVNNFGRNRGDFKALDFTEPLKQQPEREVPPYLGFGAELDELATCFHIQPRAWPRDLFKLLVHDHDVFRFLARIETGDPRESPRRFIINFHLADDSISIFEPAQRNLGIVTGKYMERGRHYKPDSNIFYGPQDFWVGGVVSLRDKWFVLLDADLRTLETQKQREMPPPDFVRVEAEYRLRLATSTDSFRIKELLTRQGPTVTVAKLKEIVDRFHIPTSDLELQALLEVWLTPEQEQRAKAEGWEVGQAEIDTAAFIDSLKEAPLIQNGVLFKNRTALPHLVTTIPLGKVRDPHNEQQLLASRSFQLPSAGSGSASTAVAQTVAAGGPSSLNSRSNPQRTLFSSTGEIIARGVGGSPPHSTRSYSGTGTGSAGSAGGIPRELAQGHLRNATHATAAVSLYPTNELAAQSMRPVARGLGVTQRGEDGGEAISVREVAPSASVMKQLPHTSGRMSGIVKRSLLEGETEAAFRARLQEEQRVLHKVIERITLKHPSMTEAFNAFTELQTPRLSVQQFTAKMIFYGVLQHTHECNIMLRHFFGGVDESEPDFRAEIDYQDFVRAMHPQEVPVVISAAVAAHYS